MTDDHISLILYLLGGLSICAAFWEYTRERDFHRVQLARLHKFNHRDSSRQSDLAQFNPRELENSKNQSADFLRSIFHEFNSNFIVMGELSLLRGAIVISLAISFFVVILIYFLFHMISSALILGVFSAFGSFQFYSSLRIQRHTDAISNALPHAVDGLIRCLKTGFDLSRSFTIVSGDVAPELQREFRLLIRNRDLGQSLGDAMFHLADRLRNPETLFLATLIAIQERSGGPLIEALTSLSQILRDRERLQQKRMVASAEARMSALILGGLPVLVASLLFTSNPTYRETLLNSQSGRGFLLLAGILLITGSVVMYRMIRIDPR